MVTLSDNGRPAYLLIVIIAAINGATRSFVLRNNTREFHLMRRMHVTCCNYVRVGVYRA